MSVTRELTIRAHAKVNLDLRVFGTRPDKFHDLRTILQSIGLHDTLRFSARKGPFSLGCAAPGIPLDQRNLVWRAATALFRALGRGDEPQDVEVTLVKRIPAQAGLGGGSSDAAATLVALTRLWRSELAPGELLELAARVGSDVPFFLLGGTALALGRGDEIYPLPDLPRRCVVILKPAFGVSTPDAYAWFDEEARQEHVPGAPQYDQEPGLAAAAWVLPCLGAKAGVATLGLRNDLERGVGRRHPDIAQMKAALRSAGAEAAAMAGSGSAVFGLFRTRAAAAEAAAKLGGGAWKVFVTRTLPRQAGFV